MNSRQRFLKACKCEPLDRPPLWLMRQAGRYLPEYQALKKKYDFITLVRTPELASEVTLQPLKRFAFDAAILFSDILVIPEALGQSYSFSDQGGISLAFALDSKDKITALNTNYIVENLAYVFKALRLLRQELADQKALLGFGGSPWTLATYMVEGKSSKSFSKIKALFYAQPDLFHVLMRKLTQALENYFAAQIKAGVDAIQIFDSWAGILSHHQYWEASGQYLAQLVKKFHSQVPIIVFPKGGCNWIDDLKKIGAHVISLDWTVSLSDFYDAMDASCAVQGNLDPSLLSTEEAIVQKEAQRILGEFGTRRGHIFNLGHGIYPDAKIDCVHALVDTILSYPNQDNANQE